jgi:chromosome segregation ATPase
VQDNGFCHNHQNQASQHIVHQLDLLASELETLASVPGAADPVLLADVKSRIRDTKAHLQKIKTVCSSDFECQARMRGVTVGVRQLISPDGEPNSLPDVVIENPATGRLETHDPLGRLKEINENIEVLSTATTGDDSLALDVIRKHELARRQGRANQLRLAELREDLSDTAAQAQSEEMVFQDGMRQLASRIEQDRAHVQKVEEARDDISIRLDQCRARAMQLKGEYAESIRASKDEVARYKSIYDNVMGDKVALSASIKELEASRHRLEAKVLEMREVFEERLKQAKQSDEATEREKELQLHVVRLEKDLEEAMASLSLSNESQKKALDNVMTTQRPYAELSRELIALNKQLQAAAKQRMALEEDRNRLQEMIGRHDLTCAVNVDRLTALDRARNQKLSREVVQKNQEVTAKQKELADLHARLDSLQTAGQNKVTQLELALSQAQFKLARMKEATDKYQQDFKTRSQLAAQAVRAKQADLEFKFQETQRNLREEFERKKQELLEKHEATTKEHEDKERELRSARAKLDQTKADMSREKQRLKQQQAAYQAAMAQIDEQKSQMSKVRLELERNRE